MLVKGPVKTTAIPRLNVNYLHPQCGEGSQRKRTAGRLPIPS